MANKDWKENQKKITSRGDAMRYELQRTDYSLSEEHKENAQFKR